MKPIYKALRALLSKPNVSEKLKNVKNEAKMRQKYQKVRQLKLVISQLKNNFFGVCKSLKPSSGNSLGPGNLFKHRQEPPVLHNSNYQVGTTK